MKPSRRQMDLTDLLNDFLQFLDPDALLAPDAAAADRAATFRADRQKLGRPAGVPDSLIAGIAPRHGAVLATGNVRDFEMSDLELVDPWQAPSL